MAKETDPPENPSGDGREDQPADPPAGSPGHEPQPSIQSAIETEKFNLDMIKQHWDEECEYAGKLENKRKFFLAGLAGASSLSVFQMSPLIEGPAEFTVSASPIRFLEASLLTMAAVFLIRAIQHFFPKQKLSPVERAIKNAAEANGRDIVINRASDLIAVHYDEIESFRAQTVENLAVWKHRTDRIRTATRFLKHGNRRVSNKLHDAAFLLGWSYITLGVAALVYVWGVTFREESQPHVEPGSEVCQVEQYPSQDPDGGARDGRASGPLLGPAQAGSADQ